MQERSKRIKLRDEDKLNSINDETKQLLKKYVVDMTLRGLSPKTYAEVMAALEAGKSLQITLETDSRIIVSSGYMVANGSIIVSFPYDEPYQQYIMMLVWNNPEVYTSEYMLAVTDRAA